MKRQKTLHDFWSPKIKTTKADAKGRSDAQKSPANQECGYMQRFSLERAAAITLTQTLVDRLKGLDITKEHDRVRLVEALVRIAQPGTSGFCCPSSGVLQKELHKVLLCSLMSEDLIPKAPVFLTIMLALCWDVEIKVARKNQLFGGYESDGVSRDICCGILKVIEEFQEHRATVSGDDGRVELEKGKDEAELEKEEGGTELKNGGACVEREDDKGARKQAPLPTKSLVFEYNEFHDETFLPRLVEKMSNLQSVSLPDGLFFILRRLPNLRSLCLCRWLNNVGDFGGANMILQGALLKAELFESPILTHLEEVCCMEYGLYKCTKEGIRCNVFDLVWNLPALRRLVLPNSDGVIHLTESLEYLQKSHVELQFRCKAQRVFGVIDPHT